MSFAPTPRSDLSSLVNPKERSYFAISAAVGVLVYAIAAWTFATNPLLRPTIGLYIAMFALFSVVTHGFLLGYIRGNAVRVSARQFPKLFSMVAQHATTLGMGEAPDVYVLQSGGALNAFATRFLGRNFVVLYSDVLAMAESRGEAAVSFVVGHELAHLKRGHLKYRWLLLPARMIPFLGGAYSRACEYTCDRFGAVCSPDGAVAGLLALAAGRDLFEQVEPRLFASQAESEAGFWTSTSEVFSSHPHLSKRVGALLNVGHGIPAYSPMMNTDFARAEA
jgi:Zn-dependent protease with chaperone function